MTNYHRKDSKEEGENTFHFLCLPFSCLLQRLMEFQGDNWSQQSTDKHYNLRSDFPVPRYNTVKYGKHSIRYLGPHIWGKISQELRSKTSLQAFRRGVRALNVLGLLDGTCGCCACSS